MYKRQGEGKSHKILCTNPDDAKRFCDETGVDALDVYKRQPLFTLNDILQTVLFSADGYVKETFLNSIEATSSKSMSGLF